MKRKEKKQSSGFLYGLTFIAPVAYSVTLQELDTLQMLIFLVVALLVFITFISRYNNEEKIYLNKLLTIFLMIIPVSFFTSFINGSESALPLLYYNLLVQLCIVILTAMMLTILGEEKFFKTVSLAVVIISGLFGLVGLLEVFKIKLIPLPLIIPPGSTLGHRSFAVEYLLPALPFILILKEYVRKDFQPWLMICAFINISFILFTRSRSAMIILVVMMLIYFIYLLKKERQAVKKILQIAAMIGAAFLFSLLPAEGGQRENLTDAATSMFDPSFRSNRLRLTYWDASLQMISESPFSGSGLYKWSGFYPKYFSSEFDDKTVKFVQSIHAHNDFLELFAENGIFAPLVYSALLLMALRILYLQSKNNKLYFYLMLCALTTMLFSLVAFPFYKFSSSFFIVFSAGIAVASFSGNTFKIIAIRQFQLKIIFLVLLLTGMTISIIRLKSEFEFIKGIQLLRSGMYPQMIVQLDKVSDIFLPCDASKQPVDYYRGVAYSYMRNYQEALKCNLRALELAPYSPLILNNVATAYHSLGKTNEAIERFEKMKELFPGYSDPQIKLLYLYVAEKQEEKGKALLAELLEKFPDNPGLKELKARFFQ